MNLPKLETPIHLITLPISKQKLEIKPYVLQMEKSFLTTINSEKSEEIYNTFKTLVNSCVVTKDFEIEDLNMNDFFYLLIQIRMKSNGEEIDVSYACSECKKMSECTFNLEKAISVENIEKIKDVVKITDDLTLEITNPPTKALFSLDEEDDDLTSMLNIIASSVSKVIYKDEIFTEFSTKELTENILGNLTQTEFQKMNDCVDALAKLTIKFEFTCVNCGHKNTAEVENILTFF